MKILLIYLGITSEIYSKSKVRFGVPSTPSLSLATIATPLLDDGHDVEIIDLSLFSDPYVKLTRKLEDMQPQYVGITFTTPLFYEAQSVIDLIKKVDDSITVVLGGPHVTALTQETLTDTNADIVVIGEGDFTLLDILKSNDLSKVDGIAFKRKDKSIIRNRPRAIIEDLNKLPIPALNLYDPKKYKTSRVLSKKNPTVGLETSRGCVFECCYCNKNIFERKFRAKKPEKVITEINNALDLGFREVQFMDDGFSTDLDRAKNICTKLIESGIDVPWNLQNGIRCDRIDAEFLSLARKSGCHRISFGVESGNNEILKKIGKGETTQQIKDGFKLAHNAGIRTTAFFLFGLPGETIQTMQKSIEFAKELNPDLAKVSIMTPYPGTQIYDEWKSKGYIISKNWRDYNQQDPSRVYNHPSLSWETIFQYYKKFYRDIYLTKNYAIKRLTTGVFRGEPLIHMYYGLRMNW